MMDRRTFINTVVASAVSASHPAGGQPAQKLWRVGFIGTVPVTTPEQARIFDAFRQALQDRGYVEGKNLAIEVRHSEGKIERFPVVAAELVRLDVDVIVVGSSPGAKAAKEASATIPIVMVGTSDPVGAGLAASLARPGG